MTKPTEPIRIQIEARTPRKIVRDNVPDLLLREGRLFKAHRVTGEDFVKGMIRKLGEELDELSDEIHKDEGSRAALVNEVVDVLEAADGLARALLDVAGITADEIEKAREAKRESRGAFSNGVYLEWFEWQEGDDGA
jgi:predicted house-cleaning noncanonical NTP pyrophosphatase (MazG superfamily)